MILTNLLQSNININNIKKKDEAVIRGMVGQSI
jgi:hypothetical protein